MAIPIEGAAMLITGASSGIGASLARMAAERGAERLALIARRGPELEAVADYCRTVGAETTTHLHDLADVDGSVALTEAVWDDHHGFDVVVHNAAIPKRRHVLALTPAELEQVMAVNFFSPTRMTMALLPKMIERDRGQVVFVSSMGGRAGIPAETAYCASKFALCGWAEAMQIDLWDTALEVRLVIPGPIDTDIWSRPGEDRAHYDGPLTPPAEVADGICSLIEGDRFEGYFPDLRGVAEFKTTDPDAYLAGAADMARQADARHHAD